MTRHYLVNLPDIGRGNIQLGSTCKERHEINLVTENGTTIFHSGHKTFTGLANDVLGAIREAQLMGYQQAMRDVRALIGAKEA